MQLAGTMALGTTMLAWPRFTNATSPAPCQTLPPERERERRGKEGEGERYGERERESERERGGGGGRGGEGEDERRPGTSAPPTPRDTT